MTAAITTATSRRRSAPDDRSDELLAVDDLHVSYGGAVRALQGVSLGVAEGSIVTVLGSNGAGKSTLLRAISGTLPLQGGRIDGGSITFAGRRLDGNDAASIVRAGLVQVPEGRRIFASLTVEENLRAASLVTRGRGARAAALAQVFDLFPQLEQRASQRAGLLSGGEQQMLAIGRALMARPRLLLLDEPSLGLAPRLVHRLGEAIREINSQGTAVVVVEQNTAMALELADVAYVLEMGRVALCGRADELATSDEIHRRYLGTATTPPPSRSAPHSTGTSRAAPAPGPAQDPGELRVDGVSLRFDGVQALADVSFVVEPGTVHALIGPNGAGKSTCVNVLTGVYRPQAGRVRFGPRELTGVRPYQIARYGVTRTFQNLALSPHATVEDNLVLGRHRLTRSGLVATGLRWPSAGRERRRERAHVREVAEWVGLGDLLDVQVGWLSYGDRKRVELGRALCTEPALLVLDEPVSGMNQAESQAIAVLLRDIQAQLGISVVLVEHDMPFVMGLATHVTVLDFGRRIADGPPQEVQNDPEVLRAYLGTTDDPPSDADSGNARGSG
jgi:ABC-type branched-subunit amino acid transport system ATPase component